MISNTISLRVIEASEALISRRPVIVRRQVKWGDCDPAQVVFTPRFSEYVVSATGFFFSEILGKSFGIDRSDKSNGFPLRALSFEFEESLYAFEYFDMCVEVTDIRTRTFVLKITGTRPDGRVVFRSTFTPICVALDERRSISIPPYVRDALERYSLECSANTGSPPRNP
ncbi:TPA: thioesterase [Burkholderia cenocepacia]|nr:thioesterase [Burkholderia cenocepacia]